MTSKLRIIKNLTVISLSFVLLFSGFDGLIVLQSTLNKEDGVGTLTQALIYVTFCISALLLPKYVIKKLGCKFSIIISQMLYIPWIASNFYPHWITLVPSSILTGIGASTLWSGQYTYFNKASSLYCSLIKSKRNDAFNESTKSDISLTPLPLRNSLILTEPSVSNQQHDPEHACVDSFTDSNEIHSETSSSNMADNSKLAKTATPVEKKLLDNSDSKSNDKCETPQSISDHEAMNARFFGCHTLAFKTADIWSNLMSYYILKVGSKVLADVSSCSCGAYFCNVDSDCLSVNIGRVSDDKRYLLSGIFVALPVMGIILLLLCLDPIEESREPVTLSLDIVMATWNQCKKKDQVLLIPITVAVGLAQAFYAADITKDYIGCTWGTYHIGIVTVSYGVSIAIASSVSGYLVKHIGRIPIISLGFVTTIATNILLLTWNPNVPQSYVFFIIASLWGLMIGSMWPQISAFYGILFKEDEEAAFASFHLWNAVGWAIAFASSNYLCTYIKIYALISMTCVGMIGYYITERNFTLKKNEISQQ